MAYTAGSGEDHEAILRHPWFADEVVIVEFNQASIQDQGGIPGLPSHFSIPDSEPYFNLNSSASKLKLKPVDQ